MFNYKLIACAKWFRGINDENCHIDIMGGAIGHIIHLFTKLLHWFMDTWSV